jgi:hypothetical protein
MQYFQIFLVALFAVYGLILLALFRKRRGRSSGEENVLEEMEADTRCAGEGEVRPLI